MILSNMESSQSDLLKKKEDLINKLSVSYCVNFEIKSSLENGLEEKENLKLNENSNISKMNFSIAAASKSKIIINRFLKR